MEINMVEVGNRVRNRRNELGLSQTDVYKNSSLSSGALSRLENGLLTPSVISFYEIAQILKCDMEWLIEGECVYSHNQVVSDQENHILMGFRSLPNDDKDELIGILNMKLNKLQKKRERSAKSYLSNDTDLSESAG